MDDTNLIQLTTLWFVILIFIQTGSDSASGLVQAIGILAIFLAYIIPVTILGLLVVRLIPE
jgi:hypothetical protein